MTAEHSVIGALLIDIKSIDKIYSKLKPEMFFHLLLGEIYKEIVKAYDIGDTVSLVAIAQRVENDTFSREIVEKELRQCLDSTITSVQIVSYADTMIADYKARILHKLLNETRVIPSQIESQIACLLQELESLKSGEEVTARSMAEIVNTFGDSYFKERHVEKLHTGYPRLDELLCGLEGGDVIVIGARPAVGKSAFVSQTILQMANQGKKIGFYNLEMTEEQVYIRFLSNKSGVGIKRIRQAKCYLGTEKEDISRANEKLQSLNITISSGTKTVSEIRSECRHQEFDCVVIDYLQLVRADVRYNNRTSEVGAMSKAIKALAMELKIPIIVLSQLNRASEMKRDKEPTMAELRESGDVEQDASVILLMWNIGVDASLKGIKVEKNRQGELGKISYVFDGGKMRFLETIKEHEERQDTWSTERHESTPFD